MFWNLLFQTLMIIKIIWIEMFFMGLALVFNIFEYRPMVYTSIYLLLVSDEMPIMIVGSICLVGLQLLEDWSVFVQ